MATQGPDAGTAISMVCLLLSIEFTSSQAYEMPNKEVVYVSHGYKIDLNTSIALVKACMKGNKLPEPVYQADHLSRVFLSLNYQKMS
jgi:deoxyinosine 3'endonuclease (endonuclease V)